MVFKREGKPSNTYDGSEATSDHHAEMIYAAIKEAGASGLTIKELSQKFSDITDRTLSRVNPGYRRNITPASQIIIVNLLNLMGKKKVFDVVNDRRGYHKSKVIRARFFTKYFDLSKDDNKFYRKYNSPR